MSILTSNYFLILLWCFLCVFLRQAMNVQESIYVNGEYVRRCKRWFAVLVFCPLIIWAAFRGNFVDTGAYLDEFRNMPDSITQVVDYAIGMSKDRGFYFFSAVIKCIFGSNENIYLFIIAGIQCFFLIYIYRKYSSDYVLSFFLFVISTDYISWIFNGMRQFLAVTLTFACFELLLKKKYIVMIIITIIASQIHGSALIVLPFLFICRGKAWNKKTLIILACAILAVAFIGQFTGILDTMLQETQYKNVVSDWGNMSDDGTNPLRVAVYSVPAMLSLVGFKTVRVKANDIINFCVNMSIVTLAFYVISIFTSGIFIGRIPIYFSLYSYILLPWEVDNLFTKQSKKIVILVMIISYLIYYYYQTHMIWGIL